MADSEMIDGHEFLIDAKPVRQEPITHQCVCLLVHEHPVETTTEEFAQLVTGLKSADELLSRRQTVEDKCGQEVSNPDQAFCDDCEKLEHHLLDTQMGDARNIYKKGKHP